VARGFDDTFWLAAGLSLFAFPMALLLRRPVRPAAVRAFAMRQLGEGIILGAAARRFAARPPATNGTAPRSDRRAAPPGPAPAPRPDRGAAGLVRAEVARTRLRRGLTLLRPGASPAGLVPQPPLSAAVRALFVVVFAASLVGTALLVSHGYEAATVPRLPLP